MNSPQKRIVVAVIFGVLIVLGAYIARQKQIETAADVVTSTVERRYVKPTDADANGIPDWQDALLVNDTFTIQASSSSSTYKKPTTVTGRFGVSFFENLLRSKMYGAFGDTGTELAEESVEQLKNEVVDELFTETDIQTFETTDLSILKNYGNQIATILTAHPNTGDSELLIVQDYLRYHDKSKLTELEPIALAYTTMVKDLLEMDVPLSYSAEHLFLLNAVNAVREDIRGMQKIETDALYTLLRTKRYQDDVLGMSNAIKTLFNTLYLEDGIRWEPSEPVLKLMVFPE